MGSKGAGGRHRTQAERNEEDRVWYTEATFLMFCLYFGHVILFGSVVCSTSSYWWSLSKLVSTDLSNEMNRNSSIQPLSRIHEELQLSHEKSNASKMEKKTIIDDDNNQ